MTTVEQPAVARFTLGNLRSDDRRVLAGFLLALIVSSCVGLIGCGDRGTQQASEGAPGAELIEVVPAHKIVEVIRWDRLGDDQRRFYVIRLPEVYTEEQMLQIARWIVDDRHKKDDLVNAVTFKFLFPGTHYGADGSIHWAPDGTLSKSTTVRAGDYRTFRFRTVLYLKGLTAEEAEELLSVPVPGHVIGRLV